MDDPSVVQQTSAETPATSLKDVEEIKEKRRSNHLTAISIAVTAAISIFSIISSKNANASVEKTQGILDVTRVEVGLSVSNSNQPFSSPGWAPWIETFSPRTSTIGLRRQIAFNRAFKSKPNVACALSAINLASIADQLTGLGYHPDKDELQRLRYTSVRAEAAGISPNGFELHIEIPLPTKAAQFLAKKLRDKQLLGKEFADDLRAGSQIASAYQTLNDDEIWLANFYQSIGTIEVSWTAQADEADQTK